MEKPDLEQWMREYGNDVLRTAYLYVEDLQQAEDIFQDVFLKAYQNYDKFRGESSVKTWLIRITINAAKDYLKSAWNRRVTAIDETMEETIAAKDEYERVEQEADDKKVTDAVLALPEHYKEVVLCMYYQEMSVEETAAALDIPPGTVKSRLSRAKQQLKELLKGGYGNGTFE